MKFKLLYKTSVSLLVMIILLIGCQDPEAEKGDEMVNTEDSLLQEEKDWGELKKYMTLYYKNSEEEQAFIKGDFWYRRKFEDKLKRNRLDILRDFLKDYPESEHYFDALKYYFTYLPEPRFINFEISKEKKEVLNHKTEIIDGKPNLSQGYHQIRTLPYDSKEIDNWLVEGDSLVDAFTKSNAPSDQKTWIEIGRLGRNLRMAMKFYQYLHLNKKAEEREFWFLFDRYFWNNHISQMDSLIFKYPEYSRWPVVVDQIISMITLSHLSPQLSVYYWEHFRDIADKPDLFQRYPAIEEIHNKAKETLKAIEDLKTFDNTQPLQMQMIGMDGKKINLKDYRGKVVMLDFWDLRCAPCIKEMPHVQTLYEKYKDRGFEVIGICAAGGESQERVQEITGKQGATWPQVLDEASNAAVSYHSLYKIERLPTVWLLDKDGVIVDKHARGNRLEPLIREYLELN